MRELKEELKDTVKGLVVFDNDIEQQYLTDFVGSRIGYAQAYVRVADEEDIQNTLKIAYAHKTPVVIRGAGTNLVGSTIPEGGIVLDVSLLNKILELDEENLTLTVEPGVKLREIYEFVEAKGYMYAPDPAEKEASIGGKTSQLMQVA